MAKYDDTKTLTTADMVCIGALTGLALYLLYKARQEGILEHSTISTSLEDIVKQYERQERQEKHDDDASHKTSDNQTAVTVDGNGRQRQYPIGMAPSYKPLHRRTIFISIASYRDNLCPITIEEIYKHADHPERIFIGLYQQNSSMEKDCVNTLPPSILKYKDNIRVIRVKHTKALGPQSARYICASMYKGEDMFMQIDSHMRCIPHWDTIMLQQYEECCQVHPEARRKVIISAYPLEFDVTKDHITNEYKSLTTAMCKATFNHDGMIQPISAKIAVNKKYAESPFIAAGYLFGPGKLVLDTPYDDDLPFLFHGEELLYSIRLWNNGYKIYNPPMSNFLHFYIRSELPKVWGDLPEFSILNKESTERVKRALLLSDKPGKEVKYGVPKERVKAYYDYFKIDLEAKVMQDRC